VGYQTHRHGWGGRLAERPQVARLTPQGRLLLVERITQQGWKVAQAAQAGGLSTSRAHHWLARCRCGGAAALADRSSAPQPCRNRISAERIAEIEGRRLSGPTIARQLGVPVSTVGKVLRRLGLGKLSALEPKAPVVRYQRERPGELIHIDVKKLGRIEAAGHRGRRRCGSLWLRASSRGAVLIHVDCHNGIAARFPLNLNQASSL